MDYENLKLVDRRWFNIDDEDIKMKGSKCGECSRVYFPPKKICADCFKEDTIEEVELSKRGRLYTYTIINVGPPGFSTPYAVGYVDLPEGKRIFSMLECSDFNELKLGADVEMVVNKIRDNKFGEEVFGYKFKVI